MLDECWRVTLAPNRSPTNSQDTKNVVEMCGGKLLVAELRLKEMKELWTQAVPKMSRYVRVHSFNWWDLMTTVTRIYTKHSTKFLAVYDCVL